MSSISYGAMQRYPAQTDAAGTEVDIAGPLDLNATAAVQKCYPFATPFKLVHVYVIISVAATAAGEVVTVSRLKATGTSVDIGSFTIPTSGLGVGSVGYIYFGNFGDTYFAPGEQVVFTCGGASSSTVGWMGVLGYEMPITVNPIANFGTIAKADPAGTGNLVYLAGTEI